MPSGTGSACPTSVTRADPSGSPSATACVTKRLHRGSAFRFCVCMAILLIRKMGRPAESSANGIREPKGNPGCLRDSVERLATGTSEMRVLTRSAWGGSGSCGDAGPVDACWRVTASVGDMGVFSLHIAAGCSAQHFQLYGSLPMRRARLRAPSDHVTNADITRWTDGLRGLALLATRL